MVKGGKISENIPKSQDFIIQSLVLLAFVHSLITGSIQLIDKFFAYNLTLDCYGLFV